MAWQNVIQISTCGIPQYIVSDPDAFVTAWRSVYDSPSYERFITAQIDVYNGTKLYDAIDGGLMCGDANNKIAINKTAIPNTLLATLYYNGIATNYQCSAGIVNDDMAWCYIALVDEENHKGLFCIAQRYRNNVVYGSPSGSGQYGYSDILMSRMYTVLTSNPYVQYTWSSVPAISGKNGILSLSTAVNSYHTGSDVSNIPLSDVSLTEPSKLSSLGANLPVGGTIDAVYAGSIDHIDVTRTSMIRIDLDIILAGQSIFSGSFLPSDYLGFLIDEENEVAVMVGYRPHVEADIITGYDERVYTASAEQMYNIWRFLHPHIDGEDPEDNEPEEGTDPDFQPDIAVTGITKPGYGAYDTGFTTQYRMSDTQLKALAQFLWSNSFVDNVKKFFNDPREIIVGLSIMPVIPDTGTSKEIKAGGISTGVYGLPLTDQFKLDTYGYANIKAEKGNFLDYNPFTKVTAHLPFVGEHSLDVNDVMGKSLTLKYCFDFLTGSCVAEIAVNGKPRYFFGGSCGMQIPTSSEDFGRMYSSILSAGATLGSTLATIATGGLTAPLAIGSASSMLANGMASSPAVQFSSGSGSVNGMIGCKTAFIVIEQPIEKVAAQQNKYIGKPSFMRKQLSSCDGFTKCMSVHLDKVPCTSTERDEIERALLNGVRIETGSTTPTYTPTETGDYGIILLKCESDMDVIGKTWNSTTQTIEGKLLYDQNILRPTFLLSGNYAAYNYAYIPAFERFYYITEQVIRTGDLTEIHFQCDPLQSFKTQILNNYAILERQETKNNAYFSDNMYWTQANKIVKTFPFLTSQGDELNFAIPEDNYILTIAGGE